MIVGTKNGDDENDDELISMLVVDGSVGNKLLPEISHSPDDKEAIFASRMDPVSWDIDSDVGDWIKGGVAVVPNDNKDSCSLILKISVRESDVDGVRVPDTILLIISPSIGANLSFKLSMFVNDEQVSTFEVVMTDGFGSAMTDDISKGIVESGILGV